VHRAVRDPGIVLAIGFYAAYAPPPLALYGTAPS
jgi:iron(III) transport system permease protein